MLQGRSTSLIGHQTCTGVEWRGGREQKRAWEYRSLLGITTWTLTLPRIVNISEMVVSVFV